MKDTVQLCKLSKIEELLIKALSGVCSTVLHLLYLMLTITPVWFAWNWLMPDIAGQFGITDVPHISYWYVLAAALVVGAAKVPFVGYKEKTILDANQTWTWICDRVGAIISFILLILFTKYVLL